MWTLVILFLIVSAAFMIEEFILIKPISTIAQSDPTCRRLEIASLWLPALGIALTAATMGLFGAVWIGGWGNAIGLVFCAVGVGLRYWSRTTLGRFFTIGVVKQQGHVVIRNGPYRWIRHPAYLAFLLFYAGLPLLIGSWFGVLVLTVPAIIVLVWLARVEDKRMAEELGDEYRDYQRASARLIPHVW
jgi:protein-S-isoprenylcysteine O-methyltransferase Ste14